MVRKNCKIETEWQDVIDLEKDEKNRLLNEGFEDKGTELTTINLAAGMEDRT
jgi:hypothetical protein